MSRADTLLLEAEQSMKSGDWDNAIETLETLKQEPDRPTTVYSKLAQVFAVRGRYLTVLSIYLEWAEEALQNEQLEQAERALEYALALNPTSTQAHNLEIELTRRRNDGLELSSKLQNFAILLLEKGDGDRCVALLAEASQLQPENDDLPLRIAETHVSLGQIESAVKAYRICINRFQDQKDYQREVEALKRLSLLRPDDIQVCLELGQACLMAERFELAETQFRAVLKIDMENSDALLKLALACEKNGKFRNGMLALNRLLQLQPESADAHARMGALHFGLGDHEKAKPSLEKAAQIFMEQGDTDKAVSAFQDLLKMDPSDSAAVSGLLSLGVEPTIPEPKQEAPVLIEPVPEPPIVEPEPERSEAPPAIERSRFVRPRMVKKDGLKPNQSSKPEFRRRDSSGKKRSLRDGLRRKDQAVGIHGKPQLPRHEVAEIVEPVFVEEVEVAEKVEVVEIVEPVTIEPEVQDLVPTPQLVEPEVEELDIPNFEQVFRKEEPEQEPEPEENPEEFEQQQALQTEDDIWSDPEADFGSLFPESELENDIFQGFEALEPAEAIESVESIESVEAVEAVESVESVESTEPIETVESVEVVEEVKSSDSVEEPEVTLTPFPWDDESDEFEVDIFEIDPLPEPEPELTGLFPTEEELDQDWEQIMSTDMATLLATEENVKPAELADTPESIDIPGNPEPLKVESETLSDDNPTQDPVAEMETVEDSEEELLSIFDWPELEFEEIGEMEQVPPAPESMEDESLEEVAAVEIVVPEADLVSPEVDFEIPDPDEKPELSFESIRAAEISLLEQPTTEDPVESEELSKILGQTLPVMPESPPEIEDEIGEEILQPEPVPAAEVVEEMEQCEEPVPAEEPEPQLDVGASLEVNRQALQRTPTDEEKTLQTADLCLRYGLLGEALKHYQSLQRLNPGNIQFSLRVVKTALWMEDYELVKQELWLLASLQFQKGDLDGCQDRLGELLSLHPEHKEGRQLMVEIFLAGGKDKLASWHLSQMVDQWLTEGDRESALDALEKLAKVSPSRAVQERLAGLYETGGNQAKALELYRELCDRYREEQNWSEAAAFGQRIVVLDECTTGDRENLVAIYEELGEREQVCRQKYLLALDYRHQDSYGEAIHILRDLVKWPEHGLESERLLVELYLKVGEFSTAEHHAENLAERFLESKSYEDGVEMFEAWVREAPTSARVRERLAQFYQLSGDLEGAKMEWLLVTETHQTQGDFERAARSLERALELEPQNSEWRFRLAKIKAEKLGHKAAALEDIRCLFQAQPEQRDMVAYYLEMLIKSKLMSELGEVINRISEFDFGLELRESTMASCQNTLAEQPTNHDLQFGWGELCYGLGALDLAIEQFQKLRRLPEHRFHSYRLLGLCFAKKDGLNMVNLALSQFSKALAMEQEVGPEDMLHLRYNMAEVLMRDGSHQAALEQLLCCQEIQPDYRDVEVKIRKLQG